jgi:TRAP-type C4-dicarboxylate transport system substrate-binding protein
MWQLLDEGKLPEFSDNMHVLTFLPTDMQMFVTTEKKIQSLSDFSGLKIRANSGQLITAIDKLGAAAVSITTTEVFMALSQKTVDGAISSPSAMTAFVWQDAVNYLYDLPICTGMNYIGMNLDVWNSLPSDIQDAMDACSLEFYEKYMKQNNAEQQNSIDTMTAAGVEFVELSDETIADIKNATSSMLDDLADSLNSAGYDGTGLVEEAREIVANSQYEK